MRRSMEPARRQGVSFQTSSTPHEDGTPAVADRGAAVVGRSDQLGTFGTMRSYSAGVMAPLSRRSRALADWTVSASAATDRM
jgi:hypothetical protein